MIKNYKKITTEQALYIINNCITIEHIICNESVCYVPEHVDVESLINDYVLDGSYVFVEPSEHSKT